MFVFLYLFLVLWEPNLKNHVMKIKSVNYVPIASILFQESILNNLNHRELY